MSKFFLIINLNYYIKIYESAEIFNCNVEESCDGKL